MESRSSSAPGSRGDAVPEVGAVRLSSIGWGKRWLVFLTPMRPSWSRSTRQSNQLRWAPLLRLRYVGIGSMMARVGGRTTT